MIRLGLRLSVNGGKEAMVRVFVTAAAVALGVGLLLAALAGGNGLNAQTDRGAWLDSAAQASQPTSTSDGLWWLSSVDQFGSQAIDRVDVAAAGPNAPVPPGIAHLPGPGSTTPRRPSRRSSPPSRRTSFVTGFRGAKLGPSAPRRCRPRTR